MIFVSREKAHKTSCSVEILAISFTVSGIAYDVGLTYRKSYCIAYGDTQSKALIHIDPTPGVSNSRPASRTRPAKALFAALDTLSKILLKISRSVAVTRCVWSTKLTYNVGPG